MPLPAPALTALARWEARPGEILTLIDPQGKAYRCRLTGRQGRIEAAIPIQLLPRLPESPVFLEVLQALPEKERFELILEKLTEIGVCRILPFTCSRSTTLEAREARQPKAHRWPAVLLRAARQCRRAIVPELLPVLTWKEALAAAAPGSLRLLLYEHEQTVILREICAVSPPPGRVSLLVGPEGGFTGPEVEEAMQAGFRPVSLGPRLLRTETASIVGAALVQQTFGDLG